MNFKEESLQLIATDQKNKFYLTPQAKEYLNHLQKPISIVSIAGMYRTGKSYLVNRLLKTRQTGFRTGSTSQAVTKGLNIWGRPISAIDQTGKQLYYIVIDSEGVGSCEQEIKYDMKLLMLIFMISSTVVYNSMGAIDQQTLDQLRVIVNLKNVIGEQNQKQKTKLVWVLRDFALQLVDKNGYQITSNQYLEQCLEDVPGSNLQIRKKNEIRRAIRQGLGKKSCFTLVRPTINEEDLADLNRCKLRTEFVSQIQTIREEVFSGSSQDLKRIEGHPLNGKLLVSLLQKCIQALNGNGMPQLVSIWEAVKGLAYDELFENILQQMKRQVSRLALPLPKQDLKAKLNEIQNKCYSKLEENFIQIESFKHYHREFIKSLQKMNKQIKRNNTSLTKDKKLKDLRQFVRQNITLSDIEPTNMTLVKSAIDKMQLKATAEPQAYQYALAVLFDILHVCEQKAVYMHNELSDFRKMVEVSNMEQRNHNLNVLALKKDYHQSLKTINNLKVTQQEHQKQIALYRHQLEVQQNTIKNLQHQGQIRQSALLRQIEEVSSKYRLKNDQVAGVVKKLRQENTEMICQLSHMKEQKLREGLSERKEVIFQEKLKQTWEKFDQQRQDLRAQIQKLRKIGQNWRIKYEQQRQSRQQEQQTLIKQRQTFAMRQREFIQQMKQLKNMHAEAKKTYNATFDTIKDNDRILKSVQNVAMSSSKLTSCRKNQQDDKQAGMMKKFYENQLQKYRMEHEEKANYLSHELDRLRAENENHKSRCYQSQSLLRECRGQKQALEAQLMTTRQRFVDSMSQAQNAKERERSLYQESIIRLLSNIEKKERPEYSTYYK